MSIGYERKRQAIGMLNVKTHRILTVSSQKTSINLMINMGHVVSGVTSGAGSSPLLSSGC
jgi:hypothetical protein